MTRIAPASAPSAKKIKYWLQYNQGLKQRGSLTLWFDPSCTTQWLHNGPRQRGAQFVYSSYAISVALQIKHTFRLGYCQTQGFVSSLLHLLKLDLPMMDYSTMQRRFKGLTTPLGCTATDKVRHIVIDSTGLKMYGDGEWLARKHGASKRRTWRKLHVSLDTQTGEVTGVALTDNQTDDAAVVGDLIDQTQAHGGKIGQMSADGAYDKQKVWDRCAAEGITPTIPPRKNAVVQTDCQGKPLPTARNAILNQIDQGGVEANRAGWKRQSGYHRRSKVETFMFRYKQTFGEKMVSRKIENQQQEARMKSAILNTFIRIAKPAYS